MTLVDPTSIVAFLDLAWLHIPPRRVHVRLSLRTAAGRQFAKLCTGEEGPCYANSSLIHNTREGDEGEALGGCDNGVGVCGGIGSPSRRRLSLWGKSMCQSIRSSVQGSWVTIVAMNGAKIGITFRPSSEYQDSNIFGVVESGMEVILSIVALSDTTNVSIVDCGVVIPL